jgi:hypothetical protein
MVDTPPRRGLRVAAVLVGLLAAAAIAELVLRATHWGVYTPRKGDYHFLRRAGDAYWIFDPSNPPEHEWDGDPYARLPPGARLRYRIDSKGLRGPEPDPARPKVLFVGDSFTFGEGVTEQDTFAARVERALATRFDPPPQVLNSGVPGYGSEFEAARLPGWLQEFKPRAVVLVYVPNDPIPLDDTFDREDLLACGEAPPALYLPRLIGGALGRGARDREIEAWYESYYFGERRARWDAARAALLDMRQRCVAAQSKFGVVIFPLLHRLAERRFARIHETVTAACAEMGVPALDLTAALAREPDQALWIHPADHHPDARAHELAAEAMTPFVESLLR